MFLCASERQRHLVVGMLAALGRVEPLTFAGDPGLDDLVRVVPFGVPSEPPTPVSPSPLRDAHPAMQPDDFLLLWAGGIYEWLDPVVLVEALSASTIRRSRRSSWAAATRHRPSRTCRSPPEWLLGPRSWGSRAAEWCSPTSGSPTTSGRGTCATPTWACPSTRTTSRPSTPSGVLDYLWAGLPILCSDGDAMADLVRTHDLGEVVPPGDVDAVAGAISRLRDEAHREGCGERSARVAADFRWDRVCQPIARFCRDPPFRSRGRSARPRRVPGRQRRPGGAASRPAGADEPTDDLEEPWWQQRPSLELSEPHRAPGRADLKAQYKEVSWVRCGRC